MFLATNKTLLLLALLLALRAGTLHRGTLDRKEGVHSLLLALVLRLLQLLDISVHTLRVEALLVHQEVLQSLAVDFREGNLHVFTFDNLRVLEQLARTLVGPVLRNGVLVWQVLQHFFNRAVLLNKLIGLHLTNTTDSITVITSTQNTHVNELHVTAD